MALFRGAADVFREAKGDLKLLDVTKRFGDFVAVDDISLHVPRGSFFAILGPSGCGKTTMLRMVAGLEQPTRGRVVIGDTDLTGSRPYERPVNTVFQSYALFPHLSVLENVAFGPRRTGAKDALARANKALSLVQMDHLGARKPPQLSGGQQQRVALARAVVNEPEVLLLDEPLGALDLKLRREMQVELKRIQTSVGLTFIHVTHDQEEAMTMADTVAVMNQGRIEQLGSPVAMYDLPKTAFTARFLGQVNMFDVHAEGISGDSLIVTRDGRRFAVPSSRAAATSGDVLYGIRPEKLHISLTDPSERDDQRIILGPGRITDVSFAGVSTNYIVDLPGFPPASVFEQNMDVDPLDAHVGDQAWVYWEPGHAFVVAREDAPASDAEVTP